MDHVFTVFASYGEGSAQGGGLGRRQGWMGRRGGFQKLTGCESFPEEVLAARFAFPGCQSGV